MITTPETWVPPLGDTESGFPYLSAAGRLVIKDVIMMGAAVVTMAQAAKIFRAEKANQEKQGLNVLTN